MSHFYFRRNVTGNYIDCLNLPDLGPVTDKIECDQKLHKKKDRSEKSDTVPIVLGVLVPVLVIVVLVIIFVVAYKKKVAHRKGNNDEEEGKEGPKSESEKENETSSSSGLQGRVETSVISDMKHLASINYSELMIEALIGEGVTSSVYKGKWNGNIVAIKSVKKKKHNTPPGTNNVACLH